MDEAEKQKRRQAERQATKAMRAAAAAGKTITYSELTEAITVQKYIPNGGPLKEILSKISQQSNKQGRGLLSVVVVDKETGDPGPGFYELAKELGRDVDDPNFLEEELARVYKAEQSEAAADG